MLMNESLVTRGALDSRDRCSNTKGSIRAMLLWEGVDNASEVSLWDGVQV